MTAIAVPVMGTTVPMVGTPVEARAGVHVTGVLDATEQEAQEGYFALGSEVFVITRQGSPIHDDLRTMIGQSCQFSLFTV